MSRLPALTPRNNGAVDQCPPQKSAQSASPGNVYSGVAGSCSLRVPAVPARKLTGAVGTTLPKSHRSRAGRGLSRRQGSGRRGGCGGSFVNAAATRWWLCHWLEWSERLGLCGTVTGGPKEWRNPSVARVLRGQLGLRAGEARRAGRPAGGGGSGLVSPLCSFEHPGGRSSREGGGCFCPGWGGREAQWRAPGTLSRRAGCSGAACSSL